MSVIAAIAAPQWALSRPNPHSERYSAAIASAVQAAPHLAVLAMTALPCLPVKVQASQNIRTLAPMRSTSLLWVDNAISCPWMTWDSREFRNTILIDIDHSDALARWQDLPSHIRPHLVMSAWSGRAHAILPLASPVCLTERGREGPRILVDLAGRLLAAALGGSLLPVRSVVKNPWGTIENLTGHLPRIGQSAQFPELHDLTTARGLVWHTVPGHGPCELKSVIDALAPQYWHEPTAMPKKFRAWKKTHREICPLGRNVVLFDSVRFWSYDRAEKDLSAITAEAMRVNNSFSIPLPASEVHSTARSIAKFMANRYRPRVGSGSGINRGRDAQAISADMTVTERQAVAGKSTNQTRTNATLAKLFAAAARLSQDKIIPTQSALAKIVGLSERRVRDVWNNRSSAVLSGSGTKDQRGQGKSITLKEYCESLSLRIRERKEEDQKIRLYTKMTERMLRRGGKPENVPPRGPDASQDVTDAHKAALAARKDCIRRQEARAEQRDMKACREERQALFQIWAQANDKEAFQTFYEQEMRRWDARELLIDPSEKEELRTHHVRKFTHLKRIRSEWQKARQGGLHRRKGVRRAPDFVDERASKICVERMIDNRNPDILA